MNVYFILYICISWERERILYIILVLHMDTLAFIVAGGTVIFFSLVKKNHLKQ